MAKQFFVYIHARPNTTDVHGIFYVGKGTENRTKDLGKRNEHHKRIVKKHSKENIIIRKLACESEQHAFDLEVQMIAKLREMGVRLANLTDGGEGASGVIVSEETRKKLSDIRKIARAKPEVKAMYKEILSKPEIKARYSEAAIQSREKRSKSLKEVWKNPERKIKQQIATSSDEYKSRQSQLIKDALKNPETKKKRMESIKRIKAEKPEIQEKRTASLSTPEARKRNSENIKSLWNDPDYRAKQMAFRTSPEYREKCAISAKQQHARKKEKQNIEQF